MSGPLDIRSGDVWKTRGGQKLRIKPINKPPIGNPAFNVPAACIDDPTRTTIWLNKEGRFLGEADHYLDLIELVTRELLGPMETNTPRAGEPPGARERNTDREQVAALENTLAMETFGPLPDIKAELADEAKAITSGARRGAYGTPEKNFERIALFWQAYFTATGRDVTITANDVSPMMRLMKEARLCETPDHRDSFVDLIGYTLTGAEMNGLKPKDA